MIASICVDGWVAGWVGGWVAGSNRCVGAQRQASRSEEQECCGLGQSAEGGRLFSETRADLALQKKKRTRLFFFGPSCRNLLPPNTHEG